MTQDIVKKEAIATTEDLSAAKTKVQEAHAAVQTASNSATTEGKAELVKIESSLVAAKQIVNDAIAKAEAVSPGITQEAIAKAQTVIPGVTQA